MASEAVPYIFGLGCTSLDRFSQQWYSWNSKLKKKYPFKIRYIPSVATKIKPADLYLVETAQTFLTVQDKLPANCTVVVSDSPLLLNELDNIQPLDWDKKESFRFLFKQVDLLAFARSIKKALSTKSRTKVEKLPIDRLGLIIETTGNGLLIDRLNAFNAQLAFSDRQKLRKLLAEHFTSKLPLDKLEKEILQITDTGKILPTLSKELINVIKTHGEVYKEALQKALNNRSFKGLITKAQITPFEIRYLSALIKES